MRVGYVRLTHHSFSSGNTKSVVATCVMNCPSSMKRVRAIDDLVEAWYFSFGDLGVLNRKSCMVESQGMRHPLANQL